MLDSLSFNLSYLILCFVCAGIIIWNIFLQIKLSRLKKRLKTLFNGSKATDLEGVMFEAIKRQKNSENEIKKNQQTIKRIEKIARNSIQRVGVIRYNPFKDTGGDQSFAIALLDSENNGVIISSLYSREGSRIYSKPIKQGKSKYPLTEEEKKVIKQAQT